MKSDTSDPCPHDLPCETLDVYVSNESAYFTDNTCFIFLPGTHTLNSNVSIHNVTNVALVGNADLNEGNVTIQCNGSGGLVFQHASHVKLVNLSFVSCGQSLPDSLQRDGETAQAALAFGEVSDLLLDSVSVGHSTGYGVLGHCVHGNFKIVYCLFDSNKGNTQHLGGNAAIEYTNCSQPGNGNGTSLVNISSSNFTNGDYEGYNYTEHTYSGTLATGLMMILSQTDITVLITDVFMEGNRNNIMKGIGGNLFLHFYNEVNYTSNGVTIKNSKFLGGTALLGGGIGATFYTHSSVNCTKVTKCNNLLVLNNSEISNNIGIVGSGLYLEFQMKDQDSDPCSECPYANISVSNSKINNNSLEIPPNNTFKLSSNGIAVQVVAKYHKNKKVEKIMGHYKVKFARCSFTNTKLIAKERDNNYTQLALPNVMAVLIENTNNKVLFEDCYFINNSFTGLGIFNSLVAFEGEIKIQNNTGLNGGGIMLCESSFTYLSPNTSIMLIDNKAAQAGGGIYVERQCISSKPFCFYQPRDENELSCSTLLNSISITMTNNTAGYAGDHIYGGSLDDCKINDCNSMEVFSTLFHLNPDQNQSNFSAVTSSPRKICFCSDGIADCTKHSNTQLESKYSGEKIEVDVSILGQFDGFVPGTVLVYSDRKPDSITISQSCQTLEIPVISNDSHLENTNIKLRMASSINTHRSNEGTNYLAISEPLHISVPMKPCPPGFESTSQGICDCSRILMDNNVEQCNIATNMILRKPPKWIGYNNKSDGEITTGIIYHDICPPNYCKNEEINITSNETTFDEGAQCAQNRKGLLCSKCEDGFSLSMGPNNCIQCDTKLGVPITVLVYGLVGILLVLILIVFDITTTDGTISGLLFYTSAINLNGDIFFPSHFKNVLTHFVSLVNLVSRFSTCFNDGMDMYSKTWIILVFPLYMFMIIGVLVVMVRKSNRLARLLGNNIIKVLATLLLLSYTKLFKSVVIILSYTVIEYPSNTTTSGRVRKLVWLSDPSQEYFSGKHIPLALVAVVFGLLILAYTLVLLFVHPLQRYSHLRCFSWMAKLKPLIDAYTAPHVIKDNCRYWEGLLLLFRFCLAVALSNSKGKITTNLSMIGLVCLMLLTISWSLGGVYKKLYLNILSITSIVNLAIVSTVLSEPSIRNNNRFTYQSNTFASLLSFQVVVSISFAFEVIKFGIVLFYHAYRRVFSWHLLYRRWKYQTLEQDPSDSLPPMCQFTVE